MISLLGARFTSDPLIRTALLESVVTLRCGQSPAGAIPNSVDSETLRPYFRASADGGLWWILGGSLLAPDPAATRSTLRWYQCQDVDRSGLLSMQESTTGRTSSARAAKASISTASTSSPCAPPPALSVTGTEPAG
jgi:hypothetical protein